MPKKYVVRLTPEERERLQDLLAKFGRRVARLARRQSAGDLRKFGERRQRRETG